MPNPESCSCPFLNKPRVKKSSKLKNTAMVGMVGLCLSGCATQGKNSFKYTEPVPTQIKNEAIVQKPYSQVWDGMVRDISKSFYVINNIDKESRIINLSFSTDSPADFVDCGKTHRTYEKGKTVEAFDYDVAGPSLYRFAGQQQPHPAWASYAMIHRKTSLEGRANIYIAPNEKDKNSTSVTVNSRYIWTVKAAGDIFWENAQGNIVPQGRIPEETANITFNTNTKGESVEGGQKVICISKNKMESEILGFIVK